MTLTRKTIRFVRTALGMEQFELAEASGLSIAMIRAIERGERGLTYETERKIRRAFGISETLAERLVEVYYHIESERNR